MTNHEVAKAFADGATKGKSLHMFIIGNTIYSYRFHFPIARRLTNGKYLITANKYSQATTRHTSLVRQCLPHKHIKFIKNKR